MYPLTIEDSAGVLLRFYDLKGIEGKSSTNKNRVDILIKRKAASAKKLQLASI